MKVLRPCSECGSIWVQFGEVAFFSYHLFRPFYVTGTLVSGVLQSRGRLAELFILFSTFVLCKFEGTILG